MRREVAWAIRVFAVLLALATALPWLSSGPDSPAFEGNRLVTGVVLLGVVILWSLTSVPRDSRK